MAAFEILAEVAIGIAGFGSIAIALGRDGSGWESGDFFRTSALLLTSLGALFLALLPIGLAETDLAPEWIWRGSSAALITFIAVSSPVLYRLRQRHLSRDLWFGPALYAFIGTAIVGTVLAQLLNCLGLVFAPNPASFFFGVFMLLMFASIMLVRIVFFRSTPR
jgi:hypothetical protein